MVTNKKATSHKRSTSPATETHANTQSFVTPATNLSFVARRRRSISDRPYTSAAIATGTVAVVAAAAAAGAFLLARRDKPFKEASDELTSRVKSGFTGAADRIKDLGQRSSGYFGSRISEPRTQQQIAEEALTLKETGGAQRPIDAFSAAEIKVGVVAY